MPFSISGTLTVRFQLLDEIPVRAAAGHLAAAQDAERPARYGQAAVDVPLAPAERLHVDREANRLRACADRAFRRVEQQALFAVRIYLQRELLARSTRDFFEARLRHAAQEHQAAELGRRAGDWQRALGIEAGQAREGASNTGKRCLRFRNVVSGFAPSTLRNIRGRNAMPSSEWRLRSSVVSVSAPPQMKSQFSADRRFLA